MLLQLSISGLLENMAFLSPVMLLISIPVGFIASAWATGTFFNYVRPDPEEFTFVDRLGTLVLLFSLFSIYMYVVCSLLSPARY